MNWVLDEEEGIKHIKAACVRQTAATYDTITLMSDLFDRYDAGVS